MAKCFSIFLLVAVVIAHAQAPKALNQTVKKIVSEISTENIAAIENKLGSFETRNIYSTTTDPKKGVGAAREWIAAELRSYSPRLQVSFDKHRLKGNEKARYKKDVEIWNVVAVLPGTTEPERQVVVTSHYDTIHLIYKNNENGQRVFDDEGTIAAIAPGVTDNGSGTAAVMELARVMSHYHFRKTIVFISFAAEEYGLLGSGFYAEEAKARKDTIEGVLNNDIIGSDLKENGERSDRYVNVYSEEPADSASRQLARYVKEISERYMPGFDVNLVFRHDRFGRGGDHSPFNALGFAAIRITTPYENYSHQHTGTDTFENTSPAYAALVIKMNASALATLAFAPKTPVVVPAPTPAGRMFGLPLGRGKMPSGYDGYDAVLTWQNENPETDLAGYAVVIRKTTSPTWGREIYVGNVSTYTLRDVNIDEVTIGVKAIDKDGDESLVAVYVTPPYTYRKAETY
jgi:acetylornithine deacetylase/succinyl-diaminopimelate desuccinylase-like protein